MKTLVLLIALSMLPRATAAAAPAIGDSVLAFYQSGRLYFAATIVDEESAGVFRVVFDDGDVLSVAAVQVRPLDIRVGDHVTARWKDGRYYPGVVARIVGRAVFIDYSDGDRGWVPLGHVGIK